jgi:hypothetical protein
VEEGKKKATEVGSRRSAGVAEQKDEASGGG